LVNWTASWLHLQKLYSTVNIRQRCLSFESCFPVAYPDELDESNIQICSTEYNYEHQVVSKAIRMISTSSSTTTTIRDPAAHAGPEVNSLKRKSKAEGTGNLNKAQIFLEAVSNGRFRAIRKLINDGDITASVKMQAVKISAARGDIKITRACLESVVPGNIYTEQSGIRFHDKHLSLLYSEALEISFEKGHDDIVLLLLNDTLELSKNNNGQSARDEYFWIMEGIIGSGRSSTLNTLVNRTVCKVSGAQAQGTRGCYVNKCTDALSSSVTFIDTEGLRPDSHTTRAELISHMQMLARAMLGVSGATLNHEKIAESTLTNGLWSNFLKTGQYMFVLDLQERCVGPSLDNLLLLMDLYSPVQKQCLLCLTKWNSTRVMSEWNHKLRQWYSNNKRSFRGLSVEPEAQADVGATDTLPTPKDLLSDWVNFLKTNFGTETEISVLVKFFKVLSFFEDRLVWIFNLDSIEAEDRDDGELPPYIENMFLFYRQEALDKIRNHYQEIQEMDTSPTPESEGTMNINSSALLESTDNLASLVDSAWGKMEKRAEELYQLHSNIEATSKCDLDLIMEDIISRGNNCNSNSNSAHHNAIGKVLEKILVRAAGLGRVDVLTELLKHDEIKLSGAKLNQALGSAAGKGCVEVVEILLTDTRVDVSEIFVNALELAFSKSATCAIDSLLGNSESFPVHVAFQLPGEYNIIINSASSAYEFIKRANQNNIPDAICHLLLNNAREDPLTHRGKIVAFCRKEGREVALKCINNYVIK